MAILRPLQLLLALLLPAVCALAWCGLLKLLGRSHQQIVLAMARIVGGMGLRLAGIRLQVAQQQRLQQGPVVLIFNHQSGLDPAIMAALVQQPVLGVAKQQLARNPLLGPLLRLSGNLFVQRGEGWKQQLLPQATTAVAAGYSIVMAPEGTRSGNQQTGPFRLGAFAIAQHCRIPIVPVVIHNSGQRLPPRSRHLQPGPVCVSVLPACTVPADQDLVQAAREMQQRYERSLAQGFHPDLATHTGTDGQSGPG